MAEFLVEVYVRRDGNDAARLSSERVERAVTDLYREGHAVRCLQSIFVPEDETFLLLFRAPSVEVVSRAVRRAGLRWEHISAVCVLTGAATLEVMTKDLAEVHLSSQRRVS